MEKTTDVTKVENPTVADPKKRLATWDESMVVETGIIKLTFDKSTGLESIEADLADFVRRTTTAIWSHADACFKKLVANGYKQKVQDSVASKTAKLEYTLAERREVMADTSDRIINKCLWDKPAEGGGRGQPRYELAIKTLEANIEAIKKQAEALPAKTRDSVIAMMVSAIKFEDKSLEEWVAIKTAKLAEKVVKAAEAKTEEPKQD